MSITIRLIQHGEHEFTYGDDLADVEAILGAFVGVAPGDPAPADLYDITDMDRSDADPDEHLTVTEDGRELWSGWLGGVERPAPGEAVEVDMHRWYAVIRQGGEVVTVIGHDLAGGVRQYESVEAWEAANS